MKPTLDDLGKLHQTDKSSLGHGYCDRYSAFFDPIRESAKRILEIGIAGGNSLLMWRSYFPNAVIHGVDHNQAFVDAMFGKDPMIQVDCGEASDLEFWKTYQRNWGAGWDLICDDAGHHSSQIIKTFRSVWPMVKPGSFYACEDLHTSYDPAYNRDNPGYSAAEFFASLVMDVNEFGEGNTGAPTASAEIDWIHFSKSLVVIKKR